MSNVQIKTLPGEIPLEILVQYIEDECPAQGQTLQFNPGTVW